MLIRRFTATDRPEWARMRYALWPDQTESDMADWLGRDDAVVIVAARPIGSLCGFIEVGDRSVGEGCTGSPVAYVEGWWVDADTRRSGVGRQLMAAAEGWARSRSRTELASDTTLDNTDSQEAHRRLGFAEQERLVVFRKGIS